MTVVQSNKYNTIYNTKLLFSVNTNFILPFSSNNLLYTQTRAYNLRSCYQSQLTSPIKANIKNELRKHNFKLARNNFKNWNESEPKEAESTATSRSLKGHRKKKFLSIPFTKTKSERKV